MDEHLGFEMTKRSDSYDYCNGDKVKRINSSMDIKVPQDCKSASSRK